MVLNTVTPAAPVAAAFRSRLLPILLLLACGATAVNAGEPTRPLPGLAGWTCQFYVSLRRGVDQNNADAAYAWVEGFFVARNVFGHNGRVATVGGSLSAPTLESMFKDQCYDLINTTGENVPKPTLYDAADALYRKLEVKGL